MTLNDAIDRILGEGTSEEMEEEAHRNEGTLDFDMDTVLNEDFHEYEKDRNRPNVGSGNPSVEKRIKDIRELWSNGLITAKRRDEMIRQVRDRWG